MIAASAASAPRLTGGLFASVLLHGGVVALLVFFAAPRQSAPSPPLYRVQLIAAPAGDRAAGVVAAPETPPVVSTAPVPAPKTPPKIKPPTNAKTKPAPVAKTATPVPQPKTAAPPKPERR